jgi:MFS family permease
MQKNFKGNIWKYFIFSFTQRRNFLPILAVYFLTLPNTEVQQIGIYTSIGYLASFLFEIPSGYFADLFGHKKTLILSKLFMLFSSVTFLLATGFNHFVLATIFLSLGWAFSSGAGSAFMHETLTKLKRSTDYTKTMSKLSGNVSLFSIPFIIVLPFFTKINISLPIGIWVIIDLIGLAVIMSTAKTNNKIESRLSNVTSIKTLLQEVKGGNFFPVIIFDGAIFAFIGAMGIFRPIYLESLGFPIVLLGSVMAGARFFWFLIGHNIHKIEKFISIKQVFFIETFLFSLGLMLIALVSNIYILIAVFIILNGYSLGRKELTKGYLLNKCIGNNKYKATLLSVKGQLSALFNTVVIFAIGAVMADSYRLGYLFLAVSLFAILAVTYVFVKKD